MAPEVELGYLSDDILLIFGVVSVKNVDELSLDEALFVESFLIPEHFQGHKLFVLMVEAAKDDSEGALAQLLYYFVLVGYMLMRLDIRVFLVLVIEAVVVQMTTLLS